MKNLLNGMLGMWMVCGLGLVRAEADGKPANALAAGMTPEKREKMKQLLGDSLYSEMERVFATPLSDQVWAEKKMAECALTLVVGLKAQQDHKAEARDTLLNCHAACTYVAGNLPAMKEIAQHFDAACTSGRSNVEGRKALDSVDQELKSLAKEAGDPFNLYFANARVEGALHQATQGLGATNPDVVAAAARVKEARAPHEAVLKKVNAFMQRADIATLERDRRRMNDRLTAIEHDFGANPRLETVRLERERIKSDLRGLEAKWRLEAKNAGL